MTDIEFGFLKENEDGNEIMGSSTSILKGVETFVFSRTDKTNPIYVLC